ncbi:carboxylesterase family protein [Allokutzneria multivorans]|uniref:Carboxylic ester hydrolase n=1 Tax=Allokutzneria multivorans TaxID=1142134 RepID=A0ABP7T1I5_9PSEU
MVIVRQGALRGVEHDDHVVWRGIPYASPPVGELRWRAPRPARSWDGVREATEFGPQAPQPANALGSTKYPASEDCLYLNVCAPKSGEGMPVLVWLHGGGYRTGNARQMGEGVAFARAGVVVVTINYRLGALGFARLDGEPDSGVCGLLDQVAALRWVRENIAAFGGDPERVTIYGVSAGAKGVANLMASPEAKGLFARAISSSGGGDHVSTPEVGAELGRRLLDELGCADVEAARAVPAEEVVAAQERIRSGMEALWLWRPSIHPQVLPAVPIELIAAGSAAGVSLLVGHNGNEAGMYAAMYGAEEVTAPAEAVIGSILGADGYEALLKAYRSTRGLTSDVAAMVAAMGDERYGVPTQRLADAQSRFATVHRYRVDVAAPGLTRELDGTHGTETAMAWDVPEPLPGMRAPRSPKPERVELGKRMHQAWVSFIRDGDPGWRAYDSERRPVLVLGEDGPRLELDPRRAERLAWGDATWPSSTWFT